MDSTNQISIVCVLEVVQDCRTENTHSVEGGSENETMNKSKVVTEDCFGHYSIYVNHQNTKGEGLFEDASKESMICPVPVLKTAA